MKVALDTNVLVSAFATRGLCADIFNLVLAEHELILGVTVLAESQRVLREKMRVPAETTRELMAFLRREAVVAGGAEVLVTGDQDLLAVAGQSPIQILTPRGLWVQLTAAARRSR